MPKTNRRFKRITYGFSFVNILSQDLRKRGTTCQQAEETHNHGVPHEPFLVHYVPLRLNKYGKHSS